MQTSFNSVVEKNPIIQSHSTEIKSLKDENSRLKRKITATDRRTGTYKETIE